MGKIVLSVCLILMAVGFFQVLADNNIDGNDQQAVAALNPQPSPSPLTRFERSLLAWGAVQKEAATVDEPSPLTRFERSLLAWGAIQKEAAAVDEPSPLTRFERSILRWAQLHGEKQVLS